MRSPKTSAWRWRGLLAVPYLWLLLSFLVPFLIVLKISLSQTAIAMPPYTPVLDPTAGIAGLRAFLHSLSLDNYVTLGSDPLYALSYLRSLKIAAVSTALLLVIGFPIAYGMSRLPHRIQPLLLLLVMLPFWTAFLIRIYAWITILQHDGLLNQMLLAFGIVGARVTWLASDTAIYLGIVYSYLPFMVLPLFSTLEKLDPTLLEAAADLGCPPRAAFWRVTVPLALPGIVAGVLLCFIPIVGEFVIPDLLGGSGSMMIGQTLWTEFFGNKDWPIASAVAVVLVCVLVVPITLYQQLQTRELEGR